MTSKQSWQKDNTLFTENVTLYDDGKYRWIYEVRLMKDWTILFLIWKILGGISIALWIFTMLLGIGEKDFGKYLRSSIGVMLLVAGILFVLSFLAYALYAALMSGSYCVLFEMDEKGIAHIQQENQAKKVRWLSGIIVLLGVMSKNSTTTGAGLLAGSRTQMYTGFDKVKSIEAGRSRNVIKLHALLNHNQVYVRREDFDFVLEYIKTHCEGAKM